MQYSFDEAKKVMLEGTPLVTRDEVLIICKEIDEDTPIDETTDFINTAHIVLCNTIDGYGVAPSLTKRIELYLSAHFAALTYSTKNRETLGPMSSSYILKVDLGFAATRYGQMAMALDPTGMLGNPLKKGVTMRSIGSGILT